MLSRGLLSYGQIRKVSVSLALYENVGKVRQLPPVTNEAQLKMREEFFRREQEWESRVDMSKLTENDKVIHEKHRVAAMSLHLSYEDPFTGLKVTSGSYLWVLDSKPFDLNIFR
jgi:hypothetical protein